MNIKGTQIREKERDQVPAPSYVWVKHHVALLARISLTPSCHPSLSSRLHPVSAKSCRIKVLTGRPTIAHPCAKVHWSMSLLLQQCPACLIRLIWIVFVMGSWWPCSCCFVGCCLHDLFNKARSILVWLPSNFFSIRLFSVHVVHPYSSIDTTAAWKKLHFMLSSGLTSKWPIAYQ